MALRLGEQQLQPHNLFVAAQVIDQVDQPDGRRPAERDRTPAHLAQVKSFHRLAHVAKDVFDARANLGLLSTSVNCFLSARRSKGGCGRRVPPESFRGCRHTPRRPWFPPTPRTGLTDCPSLPALARAVPRQRIRDSEPTGEFLWRAA